MKIRKQKALTRDVQSRNVAIRVVMMMFRGGVFLLFTMGSLGS
jgi:hypothetical protein